MKSFYKLLLMAIIFLSFGCERHYYTVHHEHSSRYYRHHHRSGVDVDVNVHH